MDSELTAKLGNFLASPLCKESCGELYGEISLTRLFNLLFELNSLDDISLVVDVINRLTLFGELDEFVFEIPNSLELLEKGSNSPVQSVRLLMTSILSSISTNTKLCEKACEKGFCSTIIGILLRDSEISVGESASKALKNISRNFPECAYREDLVEKLVKNFSSLKTETRFRIIDTYISIGSISEHVFNMCQEKGGFYSLALKEYFTDDILSKLVSMKLLEDLGEYSWGVKFIVNNSTPELLVEDLDNPMFDDEIKISIVYLLSKMVNNNPEMSLSIFKMLDGFFIQTLKDYLTCYDGNNRDIAKVVCGINCWGLIASNSKSFFCVMKIWCDSFNKMLQLVSNSNSEISLACLNSWIMFFESVDIKEMLCWTDNPSIDIKKTIESQLIPQVLSDLTSKPFPENRTLIYRILTLMIPHYSVITSSLVSQKKIREVILNYKSDSNKDIFYIKYDLVKQMMDLDQNIILNTADESFYSSLQEYVKTGPFYKNQSSEMQVQDLTS
ncbi:proteasome non-atpase 26s subunit [Cryptosporidium felis]|nr:proteasome non-atpase 26s subunit [Cryptosporidium felis]